MNDTIEAVLSIICLFLYPVFMIGPFLMIFLIMLCYRAKTRKARLAISLPILFILLFQALGCYKVWPLDLFPGRKDILIKTVTVDEYSISLMQSPGGVEYGTYFKIIDGNGEATLFTIDCDAFKIWNAKLIKKDNRIFFKSREFDKSPYIDTAKMTLNNGRNGVEIGNKRLFKEARTYGP